MHVDPDIEPGDIHQQRDALPGEHLHPAVHIELADHPAVRRPDRAVGLGATGGTRRRLRLRELGLHIHFLDFRDGAGRIDFQDARMGILRLRERGLRNFQGALDALRTDHGHGLPAGHEFPLGDRERGERAAIGSGQHNGALRLRLAGIDLAGKVVGAARLHRPYTHRRPLGGRLRLAEALDQRRHLLAPAKQERQEQAGKDPDSSHRAHQFLVALQTRFWPLAAYSFPSAVTGPVQSKLNSRAEPS